MTTKPALTIVIPTYNSANYLEKTLSCLEKQTSHNFTTVIIDDRSSDESRKEVKRFSNVQFVTKPKSMPQGAASSLNYILKKINTPLVALIDSDAFLAPNWVEVMLKILKKEKIAGAPIFAEKGNGLVAYLAGLEIESRYEKLPNKVSHLSTCDIAMRSSVLENFQFDENLYYAYDHQFSFFLKKNRIKFFLAKKTFCHHGNKSSLINYLKQQYQITKNHTILSKKMTREALSGDEISPNYLILQPPLIVLMFAALFINYMVSLVFLLLLMVSNGKFLSYLIRKSKSWLVFPAMGMIILRNIMWSFGFIRGLLA